MSVRTSSERSEGSTVDDMLRPGDRRGPVAGKKGHELGDLLGFTWPPQGDTADGGHELCQGGILGDAVRFGDAFDQAYR